MTVNIVGRACPGGREIHQGGWRFVIPRDKQEPHHVGRPRGSSTTATHAHLLDLARKVFSQRGYDGATFQEVAQRAGLTRPTMHYHFHDKCAMYREVIAAAYTAVVAPAIDRAVQESSLKRQLSAFMELAGDATAQDRSVAAFLAISEVECQTHPELRHPDHDPACAIQTFLTRAVISAVEHGELDSATEVESLVDALSAMLLGVGFYAGYIGTPWRLRAMTTEIQKLLTGTLGTGPTRS